MKTRSAQQKLEITMKENIPYKTKDSDVQNGMQLIFVQVTEIKQPREVQTTFCKKLDHISLKWSLLML